VRVHAGDGLGFAKYVAYRRGARALEGGGERGGAEKGR
jgi:hypothetical protein